MRRPLSLPMAALCVFGCGCERKGGGEDGMGEIFWGRGDLVEGVFLWSS